MTILSFLCRRTLSRYADDKAVKDFTRVVEQTGILREKSAFDAAMDEARMDDNAAWEKLERDLKT